VHKAGDAYTFVHLDPGKAKDEVINDGPFFSHFPPSEREIRAFAKTGSGQNKILNTLNCGCFFTPQAGTLQTVADGGATVVSAATSLGMARKCDHGQLGFPKSFFDPVKKRRIHYGWCEKRLFLRHLYIKTNILPRQARDKHRENSKKSGVFRRVQGPGLGSAPTCQVSSTLLLFSFLLFSVCL